MDIIDQLCHKGTLPRLQIIPHSIFSVDGLAYNMLTFQGLKSYLANFKDPACLLLN